MTESTNIVTVQMEKDQSFTVMLNGREVLDVVQIEHRYGTQEFADPKNQVMVTEHDGSETVRIELRVAQYNVLQPAKDADEVEREHRGKLIAAHEEGLCIVCRNADPLAPDRKWHQADPTRDGWQWVNYEYQVLPA